MCCTDRPCDVVHHPPVVDAGEGFVSRHALRVLGSAPPRPHRAAAVLPLVARLRVADCEASEVNVRQVDVLCLPLVIVMILRDTYNVNH